MVPPYPPPFWGVGGGGRARKRRRPRMRLTPPSISGGRGEEKGEAATGDPNAGVRRPTEDGDGGGAVPDLDAYVLDPDEFLSSMWSVRGGGGEERQAPPLPGVPRGPGRVQGVGGRVGGGGGGGWGGDGSGRRLRPPPLPSRSDAPDAELRRRPRGVRRCGGGGGGGGEESRGRRMIPEGT